VRGAALLAVAGALAACTPMEQRVAPGSPLSVAETELGRPNFTCTRPDGTRRVIWTQQPMGQYAWGANVKPDGSIDRVEPILTTPNFRKLDSGAWTADQVRCEFGPPAKVEEVGLPSVREVVWSYRFKENNVWDSLMYVYLGRDGTRLTHYHPGPDPMYQDGNALLPW
jgi:hypothetical protein